MIVRKRVFKKVMASLLCLVMLLSFGVATYADPIAIEPYWTNTVDITVSLAINSGQCAIDCGTTGQTGTTSITGSAVLERLNTDGTYSLVYSWNNLSTTGTVLNFSTTYYVTRGYTYRLTFTSTVYRNGIGETVSSNKSTYAN